MCAITPSLYPKQPAINTHNEIIGVQDSIGIKAYGNEQISVDDRTDDACRVKQYFVATRQQHFRYCKEDTQPLQQGGGFGLCNKSVEKIVNTQGVKIRGFKYNVFLMV